MKKVIAVLAALMLIISVFPVAAGAEIPYNGYIYDSLGNTPVSINGYLYKDSIDGTNLPMGPLNSPQDLFVAENDTLYIVDSGNNRVIHIDTQKNVLLIIGDKDGPGKLNTPKGVFVTKQEDIYVADTGNRRVAVFDKTGRYLKDFKKPDTPLLGKDFVFSPAKVAVDKREYLFIVSEGAHQGVLQIKPDGKFAGFFGANHVPFSLSRMFVKFAASKEQRDQLATVKPPEFSNLFQDNEGFLYTTTLGIHYDQIKRLSAVGVDILEPMMTGKNVFGLINFRKRWGDQETQTTNWQPSYEAFVDVSVDKDGLITALDQTTGRAFQYDQLGNLLFVFGGIGEKDGLFKTPSSIAQTSDGAIYIVDKTRNRIDRFLTTPFAEKVHEASKLYVDGKYQESFKPWQEVLAMNANYDLAYKSIGKALYKAEHYTEAMTYYKMGRDRYDYGLAYLEYRKVYLRQHFQQIILSIILVYIFYRIAKLFWKRRKTRHSDSASLTVVEGGTRK